MRIRSVFLFAALAVLAAGPPAAAQSSRVPASPLYDAVRDAGGSAADAASLAAAFTQESILAPGDPAADDLFGAVSLDGDRALIGALNKNNAIGAAYVFVRTGTTWTLEAKLVAPDGAPGDRFGNAVSLDGDRAAIGAFYDDAARGSVYVFVRSGSTWTQEAKLLGQFRGQDYFFGVDVSLLDDRLLVSASAEDVNGQRAVGTAYVFGLSGSTWTQEARLVTPTPSAFDRFGTIGKLSGDRALIGEREDDNANGTNAGAAYVYVRTGTTWTLEAKLIATGGGPNDLFGSTGAFDGDRALVGAPSDDNAVGIDAGAAYTFTRTGSTWAQEAQLVPTGGAAGDAFGTGVALLGDRALVGAPGRDTDGASNAGAAFAFSRSGTVWTQEAELTKTESAAGDEFGGSVALSADRVLVGALGDDTAAGVNAGSVTVFRIGQATTGAFAFLRPSAGDSYAVGTYLKAIWDSPSPAPDSVVISLRKGTGPYTVIYSGPNLVAPMFGRARYLLPAGTPAGADYNLKIESEDDASVFAVSGLFSITDPTSFTFLSPAPGKVFALGSTRSVRWTRPAGASSGTVTLALFYKQGGGLVSSVTTANDGEEAFAFPTSPAGAYYFTITSAENPLYTGRSGNFKLGVVDVTTPSGGETYDEGDALAVTFEAPTLGDPDAAVQILLKRNGAPAVVLAASTQNDGVFETTVPTGLASASDYYVLVRVTSSGITYSAKSDLFTINGTADPIRTSQPAHFALSPLTYGSREATVTVSGLADGAEVGAFWNGRLVGAAVAQGGVATVDVRGALVVDALVDGAVTADDVVTVPEGAALTLRVVATGAERTLDAALAFEDGAETAVVVTGGTVAETAAVLAVSTFPNPAAGAATIRVTTTGAGPATVVVYDVLGRAVATLLDGVLEAGVYTVTWEAGSASPGVYVVQATSGTARASQRVTVVR